ncbi:MAG: UDP-N-acetylglucosamine 2-epimerase (non-hydrolyzing) [Tannerella sp.]|jgi:UDP-GlcNAc3NAcA epimerase|nr:UDP-N-acetylglucosamine 2-epimerase (non-hydrolyzing) [Tannerella sp.]
MKIVTIIGARPQIIKAAMISNAIERYNAENKENKIVEWILHTGQHYDKNMNEVFFNELELKKPHWQLNCGGIAGHTKMLANMLLGIEKALIEASPDFVIVYGDTNSTLAGAIAASQLNIPLIHIEAGLRSFNMNMPEEKNRVLTDRLASLLFCPTYTSVQNLANENIKEGIFYCGDVMYDAALHYGEMAEKKSEILLRYHLYGLDYYLCTVHRAENTNNPERLTQIILALVEMASEAQPVIFPVHPRTKVYLDNYNLMPTLATNPSVKLIEPVDYLDMIMLEKNAKMILTDSGGIQKEAYFQRVPCVTLREETEWVETVYAGWNQIAGYKTEKILECVRRTPERTEIKEYGDGKAAEKIINAIVCV